MSNQPTKKSAIGRTIIFTLVTVLACGFMLFTPPTSRTATAPLPLQPNESLECRPGLGGQLFAAGGQVEVEILKSNSDATNDIFLFRAGQTPLLIGNDKQTGRVISLGSFPAGSELLFGIKVRQSGDTFRMGPAFRNFDGVAHARVDCVTGAIAKVSFEDMRGGGDRDYNDAIIQVRIRRKRGISGLIQGFSECPPLGSKAPFWGTFGKRQVLESDAGERLDVRCENVGSIPSYKLFYTKPNGQRFRVGLCPFEGGSNSAYFVYSGDVDRNGRPDSFVLTNWESRDYGAKNDVPNPWTKEKVENPPLLDHAISIYDVFRDNLSKYDDKYEYRTPPPNASEGRFVRRIVGLDPPLGPETEAFFDQVEQDMQEVGQSAFPMTEYPYSPADLNRDGISDNADSQIFYDSLGTCDGDSAFNPAADFDGDGCVTSLDEEIFLDLLSGTGNNRRPRAEGKNITVTADSTCTASISPSDVDDGSFDPDGDNITLSLDSTGPFDLGEHLVTLTVTDSQGASSSFITTVTVVPVPTIMGGSVDKNQLWPPNHKMVDVSVSYTAADNCGNGLVTCTLAVTSNEPVNGTGDGDTAPDWQIVDAHHVRLRAERAGSGSGRIYTVTITCTNSSGVSSVKAVKVLVPKSQNGK